MSDKLVSIIVPCYNVVDYLGDCLVSLCNQSHENLEIILVDDGSTDGTVALCDRWAQSDPRVSVCRSDHEGPSCRNVGLEVAAGDYIVFVDSDDVVDAQFVEKMMNASERGGGAVALCSYRRLAESGAPISTRVLGVNGSFSAEQFCALLLEDTLYPSVWGKMYPAWALRSIRFRPGRVGEDVFFWADLLSEGLISHFAIIDEPLYGYRQRSSSVINQYDAVQDAALLDAWDALGGVVRGLFGTCADLAAYREIQARFFLIDRALRVMRTRDFDQLADLRQYLAPRFKDIMSSPYFGIKRKVLTPLLLGVPALYGAVVRCFK